MQQMLAIIVVILTNLAPAGVTEFNLQVIDGDKRVEIQLTRQADGEWKAQSGKQLNEPVTFDVDGTKVTTKAGNRTTTEDLAKHLTIGAMPFQMKHHSDGLDFLIGAEERDGRVVEVRWKAPVASESERSLKKATIDELMQRANRLTHENLDAALDVLDVVLEREPENDDARRLKQRVTRLKNMDADFEAIEVESSIKLQPGGISEEQ
jgi:hypothetical protein